MKTRLAGILTLVAFISVISGPTVEAKGRKKFEQEGIASWYGKKFHGKKTASGEKYNMRKLTAAHLTLPFGTMVKVTNLENGKKVVVKINDRGPYAKGRIIDLSRKAAKKIGMFQSGIARVRIRVVKKAPKKKK